MYTKWGSNVKCRTSLQKGESPSQMTLQCITKIQLLLVLQNDSLLSSALFVYMSGWHLLLCFTCSQTLVPVTVLSHLTFLLCVHLGNKSTSCCVCKEPCHSVCFFLACGPSIIYISHLEGNAGIMSPGNGEKGWKLSQCSLRQSHSNWVLNLSSWLLWGKHIVFSWHFKHQIHHWEGRGALCAWVIVWTVSRGESFPHTALNV